MADVAKRFHAKILLSAPTMLDQAAKGRHNNLDLLRLIFALLVLVGHSFVINPKLGYLVPGSSFLLTTWIGTVGVAGFFAMSGFLVTASAQAHGTLTFVKARVLRIYPALIVSLVLTVVAFAFHSDLPVASYFSHEDTKRFFVSNFTLTNQTATLPGVFTKITTPGVESNVNGSLWTLPVEVRLYILIGALALFGALKNRLSATAALITMVVIGFFSFGDIPTMRPFEIWRSISIYFVVGAIFYIHRQSVVLDGRLALLCGAVFFWAQGKPYFPLVAIVPYVYALLYVGYRTPVVPIASWIGDLSYGLYIYAWPVQRLITHHVHGLNPWTHAALATAITGTLAFLSWHFIEKSALRLKKWHWRRLATPALTPSLTPEKAE